ncbi:MAG: fibrobacter succinogenes major paralogous domain-containing protein, partial [Bacteroidales bacterium]|nr:fibrobacter succinogenes major paralogous domain-containing protein [Bacteroidales bacterium]
GGTGFNRTGSNAIEVSGKLVATSGDAVQFWGGAYTGFSNGSGVLQSSGARYWSSSEASTTTGRGVYFNGNVDMQTGSNKYDGRALRCVRDIVPNCPAPATPGSITFSPATVCSEGSFTATVPAVGGVIYTWTLPATATGITATGSTSNVLSITNAGTVAGEHQFTVVAHNACGTSAASTASITIVEPVKFVTHPNTADLIVPQGTAFCPDSLSATFTGTNPTLQWYYTTAPDTITGRTAIGSPVTGYRLPVTIPNNIVGKRYYHLAATNLCGTVRSEISGLREVKAVVTPPTCNSYAEATGVAYCTGTEGVAPGTVSWGGAPNINTRARTISGNGIIQVWSDAVTTTGCNKTGWSVSNVDADCRNSTNGSGVHYFSWCYVMRYQDDLCPSPWRVPTCQDFVNLDVALGGTGLGRSVDSDENGWTGTGTDQKYTGTAAGNWGGSRFTAAMSGLSNAHSYYWSSSESSAASAFYLRYNASNVYPQDINDETNGFALRCVR